MLYLVGNGYQAGEILDLTTTSSPGLQAIARDAKPRILASLDEETGIECPCGTAVLQLCSQYLIAVGEEQQAIVSGGLNPDHTLRLHAIAMFDFLEARSHGPARQIGQHFGSAYRRCRTHADDNASLDTNLLSALRATGALQHVERRRIIRIETENRTCLHPGSRRRGILRSGKQRSQ